MTEAARQLAVHYNSPMSEIILATKLYTPTPQPRAVLRPRLIERLDEGLHRKLTLISAPAGFGKTTLASEWVAGCGRPAAWLSLDDGDSDPTRFLAYLIAALQTIMPNIGVGVAALLQSPQPPAIESALTALLNEISTVPNDVLLVLDDYHVIDAKPVDDALAFLLERLPPQVHLVIATREDPRLHLARLRARGQLTELRAADLRFTPAEAAEFLTQVMGLNLSEPDITALEIRTEGWIAGLQLAAISMRGLDDASAFIASFTGSHRFVLDYLVEEVLQRQPEPVQAFLLRTSILDRLCGPLCDAVLLAPAGSGQATLEYLEQANLFIVPLDTERRWYRYHHLFSELLRQRLQQGVATSQVDAEDSVAGLHLRASAWYEDNGLEIEAFHHATASSDVERAERLINGKGMPLHFRGPGAVLPVLSWLESLPTEVLDAHPSLYTTYASVLLVTGTMTGVEQKLQAAEAALQQAEPDDTTRDHIGRNAAVMATLAAMQKQIDAIVVHSRRALEYLAPDNVAFRTSTAWKLGYAYHLQGNRAAAGRAYAEVVAAGQASGNAIFIIMATIGIGRLQEGANQLHEAAATFRSVLQLLGDRPLPVASEVHLGLARICYEWNNLDAALRHGQQSLQLARQNDSTDRFVSSNLLLSRLKRVQGDVTGAAALVAEADQTVRQNNIASRIPEVAAARVLALLHEGYLAEAEQLARAHDLPISQARVHLARRDASAALAMLGPLRAQLEAKGWEDERLAAIVLQAIAHHARGDTDAAVSALADALALAEPGGFIRTFLDEGEPMAQLLSEAIARGVRQDYAGRLLAAFTGRQGSQDIARQSHPFVEPLSQRELQVLRLIAQGLSNRQISDRLYLSLNTVKGHNRVIFSKLQVQRRTEAVARARELGLL